MLPTLSDNASIELSYQRFLAALKQTAFAGDILASYGQRLVHATDNSIYQVLPQAVVCPKSHNDVAVMLQLASHEEYRCVQFAPRGGGTGTNGQSLTSGIVIDMSRYMRDILEVNLKDGWVRVQPGVILDELNAFLAPSGVFFAVDVSPSDRATLGGMVSTDACGKGSRVYGKTSEHILGLSCVLNDGMSWKVSDISGDELAAVHSREDRIGELHRSVCAICSEHRVEIEKQFPKMSRFLTGYDLLHSYQVDTGHLNLARLLAGAEGTLAVVTEIKLKLTPLPKMKRLVVVQYDCFDAALRGAQQLVACDPVAIETIDDVIVGLAQEDEIWGKVSSVVDNMALSKTAAFNLIEFVGDTLIDLDEKTEDLRTVLAASQSEAVLASTVVDDAGDIACMWQLRKKGVGLLANVQGARRPIPFVEDTAVPPEHLADYMVEFRALLESHGLNYGMFGHVDVGCLHVRPALDLKNEVDVGLVREISDKVCALVKKYGGVIWAEHGKGFRSEYVPEFFGETLYTELRRIKGLFDPYNQLNPGKICHPLDWDEAIPKLDAPAKRGEFDRQLSVPVRRSYETTHTCNGNAACFSWHADRVICPSWKGTYDRRHSPKGRAGMMREWLRQLTVNHVDVLAFEQSRMLTGVGGFLLGWPGRVWRRWFSKADYSDEVNEAMQGCLGCKGCVSQCPVHVDVPAFRSRFLFLYYWRVARPVKDFLVAYIERLAWGLSFMPRTANLLVGNAASRWLVHHLFGLTALPALSVKGVRQFLKQQKVSFLSKDIRSAIDVLSVEERERTVVLVQDAFTSFYDADVVISFYEFLTKLGFHVLVLPFMENGKPQHVRGFLGLFSRTAKRQAQVLADVAALKLPMVGVDPSMTLVFRDEYAGVKTELGVSFDVALIQVWLQQHLDVVVQAKDKLSGEKRAYVLLLHCTEQSLQVKSAGLWKAVFEALGLAFKVHVTGCCGMAGTYGHEVVHQESSRKIFEHSWQKVVRDYQAQGSEVLATGYSCRSQVKRFEGGRLRHPVEVLNSLFL